MKRSHDRHPTQHGEPDESFLQQRLDDIERGLQEGIRREIARREKLGLPIHVAENGMVVDRQTIGSRS